MNGAKNCATFLAVDRSARSPAGYDLGFELGIGGMATVFYGRRVGAGGFAHAVAIKKIHPHLASSPEAVSMFMDEARLAARVVHANVVTILDLVEGEGDVWAIMPYVEGEPLGRLMKLSLDAGRRIPVRVSIAIVVDLLTGLEAAHTATDELGDALGIVHRDVSPQNVLVGTDGVTRVLDFGVAKAHGRLHKTLDGRVKGKLTHMAPEHLSGEASVSTDVYAAAVVLWELLAGRRLFEGESEMALFGQVLAGAKSAPSAHAEILPALDAIVMRALSLEPALRFGSAAAMARALLDACAPEIATRAEVTAWLWELAATSLDERRRRCIAMVRTQGATSHASLTPRAVRGETGAAGTSSTGLAIETATTPQHGSSGPRPRRALTAVLVVGLLALTVVLLIGRVPAFLPSGRGTTSVQAPAAAPLPAIAPAAAAVASSSPLLQAEAASAPAPVTATPSRPSTATAKTTRATATKPPAIIAAPTTPAAVALTPPATEAVIADCDPPFVVDATGVRRYKRSCIR